MAIKLDKSYFLGSFKGFGYFLIHPNLWWLPLFTVLLLTVILIAVFIGVGYLLWPVGAMTFGHKLWLILKAFGLSAASVLITFMILMPLMITLALDKMTRKILLIEHAQSADVNFFKSVYSSTVIFFKTFFWRLFWPVIGIIGALFFGPIGALVSQVGIGHLATIDGVDLVLALKGLNTQDRFAYYLKMRAEIFWFGFFAGVLSIALSATIVGWLFWIPAVFCGTTLWVKDWPALK